MTAIRESELNAELQRLMGELSVKQSADGFTSLEMSEKLSISEDKARKIIKKAIQNGHMKVEKRNRMNILGVTQSRPVFVLVPQEKSKKRK